MVLGSLLRIMPVAEVFGDQYVLSPQQKIAQLNFATDYLLNIVIFTFDSKTSEKQERLSVKGVPEKLKKNKNTIH